MAGGERPPWLAPMAVAATVSLTGVVINIATQLVTSVLAWIAVVLATAAGGVATWAAQQSTSGRRVSRATTGVAVVCGVLAIGLGTAALVPASEGDTTAPRPVLDVASYELTSSSDFCPTSDKIDLDTGQSGHGGQTQLGDYLEECRVEGGLAELVLEQDEVHGPGNVPLFALPEPGEATGRDECHRAVAEVGHLRTRLSVAELRNRGTFCVRTDQDGVARVSVLDISTGSETHLTIAFTTWRGAPPPPR